MYSQSWSPGCSTIIFLDGNASRVPSALTICAWARAPGAPPSRPQGEDPKRSPRCDTITSVVVASKTFSRPRPPRKRPAPPESSHSRARGMRSGKFISTDSTGMFMQFDTSEEHTSELQSRSDLVCRLLLEKKKDVAGEVPPRLGERPAPD